MSVGCEASDDIIPDVTRALQSLCPERRTCVQTRDTCVRSLEGVRRGQASIEYVLLISALMVAICVLVRYPAPVEWMARSIAHAVSQRPPAHRSHGGGRHHRKPPHRHPHPCLCLSTRGSPGG
jgi:hypothetical protein